MLPDGKPNSKKVYVKVQISVSMAYECRWTLVPDEGLQLWPLIIYNLYQVETYLYLFKLE